MDVGIWLRGLQLGQYEAAFRENEIDGDILPNLTADDLTDLGIRLVGHRRKLLTAIASLQQSLPPSGAPIVGPHSGRDHHDGSTAERRQLTIMFCDLVGSTALSAGLDPEDMREILVAYQRCCAEHITKAGGIVAKYMGDGVLAYFGYPQAHEHDAERAVLAALGLVEAIAKLFANGKFDARVRVGIATGLVVVGDLIGNDAARERAVVGDTPNLAARLQSLAPPGGIVISDRTKTIAGKQFDYIDLGKLEIKGFAAPVAVWQVAGKSEVTSRSQALESAELLPLVGREEEMELLLRRWVQAKGGDGRIVLLSGEPGIGKSRISLSVMEQLAGQDKHLIRLFCSPYHVNSAFYPLVAAVERGAGFERHDSSERKLEKLRALFFGSGAASEADVSLIAELLSISSPADLPPISPQEKREQLMRILLGLIAMLAAAKPLLIILEDAHWLDPTSQDLLGRLVEQVRRQPIFLIVTARPEFQPPWAGQPAVTLQALNRLGDGHVGEIVSLTACGRSIPNSIIEQIVARADGVPLYVEELTKTILESAQAKKDGDNSSTAIPPNLQASLIARLDRLALAKTIAQIGAVIGREFSYELLSDLADVDLKDLLTAVDQLVDSGLVYRRGDIPEAVFIFKHALVQEAAYESLLRSKRQQLHARIGDILATSFGRLAEAQPELLGRHFSEAGLPEKAVKYWLAASRVAAARFANLEAETHAKRGLSELLLLPRSDERDADELDLRVVLGSALIITQGYSSKAVIENYERGRLLVPLAKTIESGNALLSGLFMTVYNQGYLPRALEVSQELLERAGSSGDPLSMSAGYRQVGTSHSILGDFRAADNYCRKAFEFFDSEKHSSVDYRFVHDLGVSAACQWAITRWHLGEIDKSLELRKFAFARMEQLQHTHTTGYGLTYGGLLFGLILQDFNGFEQYASRLQELGLPQWVKWGLVSEGFVLTHFGKRPQGIEKITASVRYYLSLKQTVLFPIFLSGLVDAQIANGNFSDANETIQCADEMIKNTDERWMEAELWRQRGALALASGGTRSIDDAEKYFNRGLQIALAQGSKMFALRLTTNLAQLWAHQGKFEQACHSVARALGGVNGGSDTPDVRAARDFLSRYS